MPIFDIKCFGCSTVREIVMSKCPDDYTIESSCDKCQCVQPYEVLPPLTSMQADNMWSGVQNQHGYFTSKQSYNKFLKDNNYERADRSTFEEVQKKSKNRVSDHIKKTAKAKEKAIADVIKHIDLPND